MLQMTFGTNFWNVLSNLHFAQIFPLPKLDFYEETKLLSNLSSLVQIALKQAENKSDPLHLNKSTTCAGWALLTYWNSIDFISDAVTFFETGWSTYYPLSGKKVRQQLIDDHCLFAHCSNISFLCIQWHGESVSHKLHPFQRKLASNQTKNEASSKERDWPGVFHNMGKNFLSVLGENQS